MSAPIVSRAAEPRRSGALSSNSKVSEQGRARSAKASSAAGKESRSLVAQPLGVSGCVPRSASYAPGSRP